MMGCSHYFACITCHVYYLRGYGSALTWLSAKTLEDYDALNDMDVPGASLQGSGLPSPMDGLKSLRKNKALRYCLALHQGHEIVQWSDEDAFINRSTGDLETSTNYCTILVEDIVSYECIDLDGE